MDKIFELLKKIEQWFDISASWEDGAIVIRLKLKSEK